MSEKRKELYTYDLIVIGGGASGMMAAGRASERGLRVLLVEKNKRLGEKLRISGGGRCNITNAEDDERRLLKMYGDAEQFLYSLFAQFGMKDTFHFFESRGLPLVIEAGKRAFPHTYKAEDVVGVLEAYLKKGGVDIRTYATVTKISTQDGKIESVLCGKEIFTAMDYLFATGSLSRPETGSTGDGFTWLTSLGHTVAKPTPTLVPLRVKEQWVKDLAGVSLSAMKITFSTDEKKSLVLSGKILFTHFGLSGPLILNSAHTVKGLLESGVVTATIDACPHMDLGGLERYVVATFDAHKNKSLRNIMKDIVVEGVHKGVLTLLSERMNIETKVHSVTKDERKYLVHLIKKLPMTIEGLMGFDRAVVADGGVPLEEIDMKTMRSKKISNLLIMGDLLHINRPSGGYSLQLCWSTGWVAGSHAGGESTVDAKSA